ncbi:MAG: maltokinase, partial [Gaiellaceae bacterium]|nr:maltokinase [Gaiellaceae bacterium]
MTAVDAAAIVASIGEDDLREFVLGRRWFASKAREVAHLSLLEAPVVQAPPPLMLALALVETRFHPGTHELYQLPLGLRPAEAGWN